MTDKELKTQKDDLWHAADVLRSGAHLAANKYGQLILGLIFLRYADILFKQHKAKVKSAIETSLDDDLPDSYAKETFVAKTDLLLTHFIDMAVQGYGWIAA